MPASTSELSAETHRYPARTKVMLSDPGGLLIVLVRGSGTVVTRGQSRIVSEGDAIALDGSEAATFTAGPGAGGELLQIRLGGALERDGSATRFAIPGGGRRTIAGAGTPSARCLDGRIGKALALMQAELGRRWTVAELSRKVGLSRAAFARLFKLKTGESPLRHLTRRRLERAAELLFESELSLAEIAERVGYESEFAFNRAFKRHHRLSPGAFRRRGGASGPVMMRAA
jgi:AraC-like DNA-binding protein